MTTTKKCLKNATGTQKKRSIETDYQDDDEIIDIDEVRKRNDQGLRHAVREVKD